MDNKVSTNGIFSSVSSTSSPSSLSSSFVAAASIPHHRTEEEEKNTPITFPSPLNQVSQQLDTTLTEFRDAAKRGDNTLFALLVAVFFTRNTNTDLPLCDSCYATILKGRSNRWNEVANLRNTVLDIQKKLNDNLHTSSPVTTTEIISVSSASVSSASSSSLLAQQETLFYESLRQKETDLQTEITQLQERKRQQQLRKQTLQAKRSTMVMLENRLWTEGNGIQRSLQLQKERLYALRCKEYNYRKLLSKIRKLSVYSDAFFIWHRGPFITINSARLGRLPGIPVDWTEINAALGQMALVLTILAKRLNFAFQRYRIVPVGSYARLASIGDERTTVELFYDNSFFAVSRLNTALKAFVLCVAELGTYAETNDKSFRLPYTISPNGDKVGDLPILFGKDIPWTRAMKLIATNIKWLIAWAFRQPPPSLQLPNVMLNSGSGGNSNGGTNNGNGNSGVPNSVME